MIPTIVAVTTALVSPTAMTLVIVVVFVCVVAVTNVRAATDGGSHFLLLFTNPL